MISSQNLQVQKSQNFKCQFQNLQVSKIKCFSKIESFANQTFLDKDSNQEGTNENHISKKKKTVGSKSSHNLKVYPQILTFCRQHSRSK